MAELFAEATRVPRRYDERYGLSPDDHAVDVHVEERTTQTSLYYVHTITTIARRLAQSADPRGTRVRESLSTRRRH